MNQFKISFISFVLAFFLCSTISAQQWTDEQKNVWTSVQAYWDLAAKGDAAGFLSYFDESYQGWSYNQESPNGIAETKTILNYWIPKTKTHYYTIKPAKIWVKGDFAYAHYYYSQYTEDSDGKKSMEKGRWTDILMKKGDRWVLIGDQGGEIEDDD